jgi:hypothetical protein
VNWHFKDPRYKNGRIVVASILLPLAFLCVAAVLRAFHPEAAGFERKGPILIIYQLCRLDMIFFIAILSYGAGYRAFEVLGISPPRIFGSLRKTFILCAFFGASLYGVLFTALGLAGLINLISALVCTVPMLILSLRPIGELAAGITVNSLRTDIADTHAGPITVRVIALCAIVAILLFLMSDVLFIPVYDPNIWEHYLHYYRAVLNSGSTQPNEVWHHFYASKAAGMIILANVLGDFFGAQIASAFFAMMAGVVIFDILLEYCESASWAIFGTTLFFLFLYGDAASGAMFKHHLALLGYASFAFWGAVRIQDAPQTQIKPLMIALVVSLAYLGFYLPVAGVIFPAEFFLVGLANLALRIRPTFYALLTAAISATAGAILVFGVNWFLTGLPEVTPMRLIWLIVDHAKVERIFGLGGIEYFLRINNDVNPNYKWSLWHTWKILRSPLSNSALVLTFFGGLVVIFHDFARRAVQPSVKILAYLTAFILPLNAFAQALQSDAVVGRMALFSIVFTTIASIVIWKRLIDIYVSPSFYLAVVREIAADGQTGLESARRLTPLFKVVRRVVSAVIIVWATAFAYQQANSNIGSLQLSIVQYYAIGQMTLKEAFRAMEGLYGQSAGTGIDAMAEYRKAMGPNDRLLRLTYDSGYSLSLPGQGIVSEPTYSVVDNPTTLLSATPQEVASYLRKRNLSHFILSLSSRLFTTVAFTSLFDPREMPKFLKLSYENDGTVIFTWKDDDEAGDIPEYVLTTIDLKRTGVLNYPFTMHFYNRIINDDKQINSIAAYKDTNQAFLTDIDNALSGLLPALSLSSSQDLLRHIWSAARRRVENIDVAEVLQTRADPNGDLRIARTMSEAELKKRLLTIFADEMRRQYTEAFGPELAELSFVCDERVTFAIQYPSWAVCR